MNLVRFIKNSSAFGSFADVDIEALASSMEVIEFPPDHVLISQGVPGSALYMLVSGTVKVSKMNRKGEQLDLKVLQAGEMFGLLSLLDNMSAAATCTTIGPVTVACIHREKYKALDIENRSVGFTLRFVLASQLARDLHSSNRLALADQHAAAE